MHKINELAGSVLNALSLLTIPKILINLAYARKDYQGYLLRSDDPLAIKLFKKLFNIL